ncbi:MAG: Sapep family Mn(2+)-dependent dipeptidase, partial [Oscillospiraceae bacterium]
KAIEVASKIAEKYGFKTTNFDNYALTVDFSEDEAELAILSHLDIVPVGTGWTKDPLNVTIEDGKIYGRGTSDDKGPAITALFALRAIKELNIPISKNVRLIMGADEETGSRDLEYYFKKEKAPKYCFTPDAEFPIINGEKAGYGSSFVAEYSQNQPLPCIISVNGGHTSNVVPQESQALISGLSKDVVKAIADEKEKELDAKIQVSEQNNFVKINVLGKSAHASRPENGVNAVTAIIDFLSALPLASGELTDYIKSLNVMFPHKDYNGIALGIDRKDDIMGELTCSFNILSIEKGKIKGTFDIRATKGCNEENTALVIKEKMKSLDFELLSTKMSNIHYVSPELPFIKTMLSVYEGVTGRKGECQSIGGGTYVHEIENGIAFGPSLPETDTKIHEADEFAVIDELILGARMYAEIIAEVCK